MVSGQSAMDELDQAVRVCTACALHTGRTNAVPGEGSSSARLMFIGEGPGYNEDRQGRPFVGAAGQFLNELLRSIGLQREEVYITNMVKCRPPDNRDPFLGEIAACAGYLDAQIAAVAPDVIVPLGRHALSKWFPNGSIGSLRAKARRFGGVTLFPLYHPAAALHNGGLRSTIEEDFRKLRALLDQLEAERAGASATGAPGQAEAPGPASEPPSQQLSMF